ncbi:hypothetical protein CL619_03730 [archaeon]|nr:hypothetical protein [archaeon]|tara:strand:- start:398 stop:1399 length:1002 start_codon:yes stop_codon:yes gene_type:complete
MINTNDDNKFDELKRHDFCLCCIRGSPKEIGSEVGRSANSIDQVIEADIGVKNLDRNELTGFFDFRVELYQEWLSQSESVVEDYKSLSQIDEDAAISGVRKSRKALEKIFAFSKDSDALVGKELFEEIYLEPKFVIGNDYTAVNIVLAAAKAGVFKDHKEWAKKVVQRAREGASRHPTLVRTQMHFLKYIEDEFERLEPRLDLDPGLQTTPSTAVYELDKLYLDGKFLGMYSNITLDKEDSQSSAGAVWFTEERVDYNITTGDQWQVKLWFYNAEDDTVKELRRDSFWTSSNPYSSLNPPTIGEDGKIRAQIEAKDRTIDLKIRYEKGCDLKN